MWKVFIPISRQVSGSAMQLVRRERSPSVRTGSKITSDSVILGWLWYKLIHCVVWIWAFICMQNGSLSVSPFTFSVVVAFMLYHCRVLNHHHSAHGLFTSHSSPSSLMLLFVELNIEKFACCLSLASICHATAWLGEGQWNCADFRCIHGVNNNWDTLCSG